jgi:hypothetical protein
MAAVERQLGNLQKHHIGFLFDSPIISKFTLIAILIELPSPE